MLLLVDQTGARSPAEVRAFRAYAVALAGHQGILQAIV